MMKMTGDLFVYLLFYRFCWVFFVCVCVLLLFFSFFLDYP